MMAFALLLLAIALVVSVALRQRRHEDEELTERAEEISCWRLPSECPWSPTGGHTHLGKTVLGKRSRS